MFCQGASEVSKEQMRCLAQTIDFTLEGENKITVPLETCGLPNKDLFSRFEFSVYKGNSDISLSQTQIKLGKLG